MSKFILSSFFFKITKTLQPQNLAALKTTESCSHMTQPVPTHRRCRLYNHSHSTVSSNRLRWVSIQLPYQNPPYNRSDHFQIYNRITYFVIQLHQYVLILWYLILTYPINPTSTVKLTNTYIFFTYLPHVYAQRSVDFRRILPLLTFYLNIHCVLSILVDLHFIIPSLV